VCNIPDYCIDEVADHTLAFILAMSRQVVANALDIRAGKWGLATPLTAMSSLKHLTIGIVGFGRIGREVVKRLLAFKARVLVFDPVVAAAEITDAGAVAVSSFDELLAQRHRFPALSVECEDEADVQRRGLREDEAGLDFHQCGPRRSRRQRRRH
jgi:D-3-phosphoglycerate dehydrogenase